VRIAAFDIGTNNVRMLVAELGGGTLTPRLDLAEITRLGRGVDRTRRLDGEAVARTLEAIHRFVARARELGVDAIAAVGTSATRDAENGPAFLASARALVGIDVEIVSGAREAELAFAGALTEPGLPVGRIGMIDVGGGSTELAIGARAASGQVERACVEWSHSYDVGSVRLFERLLASDPPTSAQRDAVDASVAHAFASHRPPTSPELAAVVALAGTATAYAAIDAEARGVARVSELEVARIDQLCAFLARLPLSVRQRVPGLDPGRADVVVAGGTLLAGAARALGVGTVRVSDRGVRFGLALERAYG
jgi:exopolyphosphatase/guanosine-5'-triphosphate,3'-diphosphate pyrophosphatase